MLQPLNRISLQAFLREARLKVWHNTTELQAARLAGAAAYDARLAELEVLSAARIADLLAPGQVLLRLAVARLRGDPAPAGLSSRWSKVSVRAPTSLHPECSRVIVVTG